MTTFLAVAAVIGLIVFAIGAVLFLVIRPALPIHPILMVVGGLIFAIAEVILRIDALI